MVLSSFTTTSEEIMSYILSQAITGIFFHHIVVVAGG